MYIGRLEGLEWVEEQREQMAGQGDRNKKETEWRFGQGRWCDDDDDDAWVGMLSSIHDGI